MKLIFCALILLCSSMVAYAGAKDIKIYQGDKLIDTLTKEQFVNLNLAAEDYVLMLNAEEKGNLIVTVESSNYDEKTEVYSYTIRADWQDPATMNVIHTITLSNKTVIPKDGVMYSKFRVFYRDTCEYATPILTGILIVIIVLLG